MHQIRLKRPWLRSTPLCDQPIRVDVPDNIAFEPERGEVCRVDYARIFNRPTGLTERDRIAVVIAGFQGDSASVELNGQILVADSEVKDTPLKIDITASLAPSNQLSIRLSGSPGHLPRLDGAVHLEIDEV